MKVGKEKSIKRVFFAAAIFSLLVLGTSLAQNPPPGSERDSSLEVLERRFQRETEETLEEEGKKKPELGIERPPQRRQGPESFYVRHILLKPHPALSSEAFESLVSPAFFDPLLREYEGRELTFDDLKKLARRLEQKYLDQGYLATVSIPPQSVLESQVVLQVLLARMGELYIKGAKPSHRKEILSHWKISAGEFLRMDKAQKSILRMNENPNRLVHSFFSPGVKAGTTDVHLKVEERFPMHLSYTFDNHGVKLTGRERHGFTFRYTNLLGLDDTFMIGTVFGNTYGALSLKHLVPLTSWGARFLYGFTHAQANPKKEFKIFGVNSIFQIYDLALRQRLLRGKNWNLDSHIGFHFKEKKVRNFSRTTAWNRLRILSLGTNLEVRDRWGDWRWGQNFFFSFSPHGDGFPLNSRKAETSFFKYTFWMKREQKLLFGTRGVVYLEGQLSPGTLLPEEQMFLGGSRSVRGYPEADYASDQALVAQFEWQSPLFLVPKGLRLPGDRKNLRDQLQLLAFLDYGYGRLRDPLQGEFRSKNLLGIGGGFRIYFRENLSARFEWAAPLGGDPITESGNSQFYFNLRLEI